MNKSRKVLRKVWMVIALVMKDQRRKQPVNWLVRGRSLCRGFISESTILYGINRKNHKQYLSDYQLMKTGRINKEASVYLNNKVAFVNMLEGVVEMPTTLGIIKGGQFIQDRYKFEDAISLLTFLRENSTSKVVIKPIVGAEGRGVSLVQWKNGKILMNDKSMTQEAFINYLRALDSYFVSEFIQQGEFSQMLFGNSLNTIRMLTMINPETKKAFIAGSVFRVGTNQSAPTDNFRRHGLSVEIDFVTGGLGKAARIPQNGKVNWYETHPDTGIQLTGQVIPHWEAVKEDIVKVTDYVYQTKGISYVGWDVVLTDQGVSLLEGNSWPGVSLHQVHQPLLADPQVKAFYQALGVVK